jgi:hypothetical protein
MAANRNRHKQQTAEYDRRTLLYLKIAAKGAAVANTKIGLKVLGNAKRNVPVRTGNLRASGFVVTDIDTPEDGGGFKYGEGQDVTKMEARHNVVRHKTKARTEALSTSIKKYGAVGFSAIYALAVHENVFAGKGGAAFDFNSETYTRGARRGRKKPVQYIHSKVGGWKFLEYALRDTKPLFPKIYKRETQRKMSNFSKRIGGR